MIEPEVLGDSGQLSSGDSDGFSHEAVSNSHVSINHIITGHKFDVQGPSGTLLGRDRFLEPKGSHHVIDEESRQVWLSVG
jgi:hypothetical protein